MMKTPVKRGIATKIRWMILATSAGALLLATLAFALLEARSYRAALVERLSVMADVIATNSTAAIAFSDPVTAEKVLAALRAESQVNHAMLLDLELKQLAQYQSHGTHTGHAVAGEDLSWINQAVDAGQATQRFDSDDLDLFMPVRLDEEVIGYLVIEAHLDAYYRQMGQLALFVLAVLVLVMIGVYALSNRLQRRISGPIQALAEGMREVSEQQDYALRVSAGDDDEVGELIKRFNDMLGEVGDRDRELAEHRQELESKVEERTADLLAAKDAAEAASRAKSDFLATMSHEIRTPMNGVLGMTELLLDSGMDMRQQRLAETAHRSGENLLAVINDILDFSKIEAGKLQLDEEDFDLRELMEDTLELLAGQAHRKGLELVPDLPPDLPRGVRGDPVRLRQVLVNLLGNAVKFTDHGEVRLSLQSAPMDDDRLALRFAVSDTGPGISSAKQSVIFDAFSQADGSTTRRYGGTGLGLAISQRLVTLMGGGIELESEEGQGATFHFTIGMTQTAPPDQALGDVSALRGLRALLVDDHAVNREILHNQISAWGMRDAEAEGGRDALQLLRQAANDGDPFRIVLLDWHMPGMDGMELARAIQSDPLIPPLQMIMLSSAGFDADSIEARQIGVECALNKPVRQQLLLQCLRRVTGSSAEPSQVASSRTSSAPSCDGRILVVEDNPINHQVARDMLELLGFSAELATDGSEAVKAVADNQYDLILMDCHMPVLDGFGAARGIREIEAREGRPRAAVVALTADVQKGIQEQCREAGMDAYMSKPFSLDRLRDVLNEWLPQERPVADQPAATPAPSLADATAAVIDDTSLQQLRSLGQARGKDLLGDILRLYLEHAPQQVQAIHAALSDGAAEHLHKLSHNLKSSSAQVGAMALSETFASLETAAREGRVAQFPALVSSIETQLPKVLGELQRLLTTVQTQPDAKADMAGHGSILLVDDDAGFRLITGEALRQDGFEVEEASSGPEALRRLERHPLPDLVLLDAVMDDMGGFEVCSQLRRHSVLADLPVLMVTGLDDVASVNRAFEVGASGFTTKPINVPVLSRQVRFMLRAAQTETALRDNQSRLAAAQRIARLGSWRWDIDSNAFDLSDQLARMCQLLPSEFGGDLESYLQLVHEVDRVKVRKSLEAAAQDGQAGSLDYRLVVDADHVTVVHQELELRVRGDGVGTVFGTVQDISRQRAAEAQIRKLAYYDELTGLASRSHLQQRLHDNIKAARRRGEQFALLFLDLDGFKHVNDSLGHDVGDRLLTVVAARLRGMLRDTDFAARLGGDEFCLVIDQVSDEYDSADVAERCLREISAEVDLGARRTRPHVSIGIAHYPRDGEDPQSLLKAADSAMYAAKRGGRHRYAFYTQEMTTQAERRLAMEQELRLALENDEFILHYQPQVDIKSGKLIGVEALVRWQHPRRGLLAPGEFIAVMERIGLIKMLGEWVLRTACAQAVAWHETGLPGLQVAVNISPLHFADPAIIDQVSEVLRQTGMMARDLELEITETAVQATVDSLDTFHALKALGVGIAIDDFGTGYSSLGSLKHLPIDKLKIDRVFVRDMLENAQDAVILGTIVGLAHAMGYAVIAEGVEHLEQIQVLAGFGCDQVQGFYVARPQTAERIADLVGGMFNPQLAAFVRDGNAVPLDNA